MMVNTKKEGAVASHRGRAERRNNYPYLAKIIIPTLVIAGEEDYFFPVAEMKKVAEQIPEAMLEIIEEAGHMPNMEQAEKFNALVKDFLDKLR